MNCLILDDHPLVRASVSSIVKSFDSYITLFEADSIDNAVKIVQKNKIEISIVDINLNNESGFDYVELVKKNNTNTKCVILTSSVKLQDYIKSQALNVDGYILKKAYVEDIIYALNTIVNGRKYIDPEIMQAFCSVPAYKKLTTREYDILTEAGKGASNAEIAHKFYISEATVKKHMSSILTKLDVKNRTEAVCYISKINN